MPGKRYRLAQRRKAAGYTQETFARALGVDRSTVVRWESGVITPQPWQRRRMADLLNASLDEIDELLLVMPRPPENGRLEYVMAHPSRVDPVAVGHIREQIWQLASDYDHAPSSSLLGAAGQCHGQTLFLHGHAPGGRVRRELCSAVAESATLMGQLVWDASQRRDHAAATNYFDTAVQVAEEIRDPVTEAQARLRKSFVALYGWRDAHSGLALAGQAGQVAASVSHVLAGLALLHMAEAHAMLDQRRECESCLAKAQAQFEEISTNDIALDWFNPAQFDRLAGSCYLFLGETALAQPFLDNAAHRLHNKEKSRAIVLANLALCQARRASFEDAAAALNEAIDVLEQTRGGGGMNIAVSALRELRPVRTQPWVQELHDRMFALVAG